MSWFVGQYYYPKTWPTTVCQIYLLQSILNLSRSFLFFGLFCGHLPGQFIIMVEVSRKIFNVTTDRPDTMTPRSFFHTLPQNFGLSQFTLYLTFSLFTWKTISKVSFYLKLSDLHIITITPHKIKELSKKCLKDELSYLRLSFTK